MVRGQAPRGGDRLKGVYPTPDWIFQPLDALFHFDLDVAASAGNAKCKRYYTVHDNGLEQPWDCKRAWWGNPPYERSNRCAPFRNDGWNYGDDGWGNGTGAWVAKAWREVAARRNRGVLLLPVKADARWYSRGVWGQNEVVESRRFHELSNFPGRWYRLKQREFFMELLELEGRVEFVAGKGGWFASAIVVFNSGPRPQLPRVEFFESANVST